MKMWQESLQKLAENDKLNRQIVLWGINHTTPEIINWLRANGYGKNLLFIVDNFKYTFCRESEGVMVVEPERLREYQSQENSVAVLFSIRKNQENVRKQLEAYGISEIYNLMDLDEKKILEKCNLPYHFDDRSHGKKYLCYILAGYDPILWNSTLARVEAFQTEDVDYCLVSSGKYVAYIDELAKKNNWSYLYTETNQVCFVQNTVIELHPAAEYIFKMDEDMFIGKGFFERMIQEYHRIEREGEYRIGFVVPVIPLNCCGYVSYLKLSGQKEAYEQRFGRAYRSGFSAVFNVLETAEFLWDTMDTFDAMAQKFSENDGYQILNSYFNIGCILFSRSRWLMMGKWPEKPGESGMGTDEAYIYHDNVENGLSIYEVQSVLAGHLAFGHQKKRMIAYYQEHPNKFQIDSKLVEVGMKKVCAMTSTIFCPDKPAQSIRELRAAGIHEIMFDFAIFMSAEGILYERGQKESKWKPELTEKYFHKVTEEFRAHEFMPTIARLPFTDVRIQLEDSLQYEELHRLSLRIDKDCIRACEEMGCANIIIQPLSAGVEHGQEWEINREFLLELASSCKKEETKLLLTNQCYNRNGHLIRGVCADGEQASVWIDELNREAGIGRFGFCLDIGNCNLCGQDMQSMAEALGGRIHAVILTENDGQKMARLLPFTSAYGRRSTLDWLSVIRGLRGVSFDGYLILETVDTTVAFSPLLQPHLFPVYSAVLDYFEMQIGIERDLKKYKRVVLFGAGNMCRNYMKCYGRKYPPLFTCDNNPKLWGTEFEGLEIKNPEELKNLPADCGVIICNIFYREIEAQLRSMGIENIGYFNDEYMPSFYYDRLQREEE